MKEPERLRLQASLDAGRSAADRNRLGQFATPPRLAHEVVRLGLSHLHGDAVRFLDPAFGTGSFYAALCACAGVPVVRALGIEIDDHYGDPSRSYWSGHPIEIRGGDFTRIEADPSFNLVVCNPPYVRHHHLAATEKSRLVASASSIAGTKASALSGLYLYFMLLSLAWMESGGVGVWLVPAEFMDVNYGRALKTFLLDKVTLLRVHRADPRSVEFADALVSSAVVVFRNGLPAFSDRVRFTFGGSIDHPLQDALATRSLLRDCPKWTRLPAEALVPSAGLEGSTVGDLFHVRRGIATGCNGFFILAKEQTERLGIPSGFLKPILPSPRRLVMDEVRSDPENCLVDCPLHEDELRGRYPALWTYLQAGVGTVSEGYLCRHRRPWYSQEQRDPAPILCTYMGRGGRPFRFIRNRSRAICANGYLMLYPRADIPDSVIDAVWSYLRGPGADTLLREGRVYGGGLHKLEPRELASVPLPMEIGELAGYSYNPNSSSISREACRATARLSPRSSR